MTIKAAFPRSSWSAEDCGGPPCSPLSEIAEIVEEILGMANRSICGIAMAPGSALFKLKELQRCAGDAGAGSSDMPHCTTSQNVFLCPPEEASASQDTTLNFSRPNDKTYTGDFFGSSGQFCLAADRSFTYGHRTPASSRPPRCSSSHKLSATTNLGATSKLLFQYSFGRANNSSDWKWIVFKPEANAD
ncbi:hypothetical protein QQF64_023835 [Cirrhinus molitorella]|uniref:Uncharacterized protein n=1 Tax=Cirrhinus molitorella TaxID=172907 RepID=A0ABR3NJY2_9TELE